MLKERLYKYSSKSDVTAYIVLSTWTILVLLCKGAVQLPASMMSLHRQSPRSLNAEGFISQLSLLSGRKAIKISLFKNSEIAQSTF